MVVGAVKGAAKVVHSGAAGLKVRAHQNRTLPRMRCEGAAKGPPPLTAEQQAQMEEAMQNPEVCFARYTVATVSCSHPISCEA